MNNCTIAITIVNAPEVRYTHDGVPLGQCHGTFYSSYVKEDTAPTPFPVIRILGFGESLANEMIQLQAGEQYIMMGRIQMRTAEQPEGYKEKKAELIVNQIQGLSFPSSPETDLL